MQGIFKLYIFHLTVGFQLVLAANAVVDNPDVVPVQQLDYVYLPKGVVESLLPRKTRRHIRVEACEIASSFGLSCPENLKTQLQLIDTYQKYRKIEADPSGGRRKAINEKIVELTEQLNMVVNERRLILLDLNNAANNSIGCNSFQISDARKAECSVLHAQIPPLQAELAQLNSREMKIIKSLLAIKREQRTLPP